LTEAVANSYFSLLAYKDEYEVARLYSSGEFEKTLSAQFEGDYRLHFHLAPPLMAKRDPITGKPVKREFGPWVLPLFRVLARLKGLRGGRLDLFGYSAERKMERELISGYEQDIDRLLAETSLNNYDSAVSIAELPQQIRGFGHVKQANLAQTVKQRDQLMLKFSGADTSLGIFKP
jgi:indolepyruvate ferredoxin oxidoreductase